VPGFSRTRLLWPLAMMVDQPPDGTTYASAAMNVAAAEGQYRGPVTRSRMIKRTLWLFRDWIRPVMTTARESLRDHEQACPGW
jgi:hypothetical protein